jgi:ribose 5-phosphate isomerase B
MAMAANKIRGARAAACTDAYTARMSREHNDSNVLALGARIIRRETAIEIVGVWLVTEFAGGRHLRRIEKLERSHASAENEAPNGSAG